MNCITFHNSCIRHAFIACCFPWLVPAETFAARPLVLTCPDAVTITAAQGECDALLDFSTLDWSSTVPLTDTLFDPGPGFAFPVGITEVTLTVTESGGGMASCTFEVTVLPFSNTMVCDDNIPVDLDTTCTREVTYDMILEGFFCPDEYQVNILGPNGGFFGNVVDVSYVGPEEHTVKVTNTLTGQSCWGTIIVQASTLPMGITCPTDTLILCNSPIDSTTLGTPGFFSCFEPDLIALSHFDNLTLSPCGDDIAFELNRTWVATDTFGNNRQCIQHITARRAALSEIVFPDDVTIPCSGTENYEALADTSLTGIPLLNGLSPISQSCGIGLVVFSDSVMNVCGASYEIMRNWLVFDDCADTSLTHTQFISIIDNEAPVFTIPDTIFISTDGVCGLDAFFPSVNMQQECSPFEVVMQTPWNVTNSNGGYVGVNTIAGEYIGTYTVTDACGNVAIDTVLLLVTDGTISQCPENQTITCDFYTENLEVGLAAGDWPVLAGFGYPSLFVNCPLTATEAVQVNVNGCGEGTIVRTMGTEEAPDQCQQTIEVVHVSDFVVEFPADITITCGQSPFDAGEPEILYGSCENIGLSYTDQVFTVTPDACFKILRTWVVKNTCIADTTNPVVEVPENQLGLPNCDLDGDGDCDNRTFRDSWTAASQPTDPGSNAWDGYITYEQVIKIIDYVDPIFTAGCTIPNVCVDSSQCAGTVLIPMQAIGECGLYILTAQIKIGGVWLNGLGTYTNVPPGTYNVRYVAADQCNNQTQCLTTVKVVDCIAPTAVCESSFTVSLNQSWTAEFSPDDFDAGSFDNCPGTLQVSFSQDMSETVRIYTCDDLGQNPVIIWVTDMAGNQSFCETFVIVQMQGAADCESPDWAGLIHTEDDLGISNVSVTLSGVTVVTDTNGFYPANAFGNFPDGLLTPYKNDTPLNGVSTFDIVLITKHILNSTLLDSPYKIIAADANHSNSVTTFDVVTIRRLILGEIPAFPNNTSWRFVPDSFVFPNPMYPFATAFPETIIISPPYLPEYFDFVGLKVGDVNNSAAVNFASAPAND
ncbi:MAG: HYR domain-containing protein [Bacteroidetes bacterium]|nr:HYR domain-containing protein [Bacteroidota bacterium]